jgi:uncharacterized membrane protein
VKEEKMVNNIIDSVKKVERAETIRKERFDPFRIISDEKYETNLNAIIAYYQMTKGKNHGRFRAA